MQLKSCSAAMYVTEIITIIVQHCYNVKLVYAYYNSHWIRQLFFLKNKSFQDLRMCGKVTTVKIVCTISVTICRSKQKWRKYQCYLVNCCLIDGSMLTYSSEVGEKGTCCRVNFMRETFYEAVQWDGLSRSLA